MSSPDSEREQPGLFEAGGELTAPSHGESQQERDLEIALMGKGRVARRRPEELPPGLSPDVRKADRMLVMLKASKAMTVTARKLNTVMIAVAQHLGIEREEYICPLADLARLIGFSSRNHLLLKETLQEMQGTLIDWTSPSAHNSKEDGPIFKSWQLLGTVEAFRQAGKIYVRWDYPSKYRREILEPMPYAVVSIPTIQQLRTVPGFALYEICARYKNTATGFTTRHHWRWWKEALKPEPGKGDSAVGEFKAFNRDVLKRAVAEVNHASELEITLVTHKLGRGVGDLQFQVRVKRDSALDAQRVDLIEPVDPRLLELASMANVKAGTVDRLMKDYGPELLTDSMKILQRRLNDPGAEPIRDRGRYLEGTIKKRKDVVSAAPNPMPAQRATEADISQLQWQERQMDEAWNAYANVLTEERRMVLREDFDVEVLFELSTSHRHSWKKDRERGHLVRPLFRRFLAEKMFGRDWLWPEQGA